MTRCLKYSPDYQAMGDCRTCGHQPENCPTLDEQRVKELESALRRLVNECKAEFMVDGKWSNDGQLVRHSTVKHAIKVLGDNDE